ncbi:MAG: DUF1376 domain-containing protein [Sedimentisphaerales bacterium]|nr:DUF1376 domain-containing protein [Sedimentisphaerales bacterium]
MKKRNKIRYVFLDYDKFLYDCEFIYMKPIERGIYCTLILFLYSKGGYLELNEKVYRMCNSTRKQFEHAWKTIGTKFKHKRNKIYHEKVLKELEIARSRSQMLTDKGLKGANARWNKDGQALPEQCTDDANENEKRSELNENENMKRKNEKRSELNKNQNENPSLMTRKPGIEPANCQSRVSSSEKLDSTSINSAFSLSNSVRDNENDPSVKKIRIYSRGLKFSEFLNKSLIAKTRSDRTAFNNICKYINDSCLSDYFSSDIYDKAERLVTEAKKGNNPNALFMSLARKELGYKKQPMEEKKKDIVTETIENFGKCS